MGFWLFDISFFSGQPVQLDKFGLVSSHLVLRLFGLGVGSGCDELTSQNTWIRFDSGHAGLGLDILNMPVNSSFCLSIVSLC